MLNIIVFVIAFTIAQVAAGLVMVMLITSKWYAKKVTKMTQNIMENANENYPDF